MSRPPLSIRFWRKMPECGNDTPDNYGSAIEDLIINDNNAFVICKNASLLSA
jgi:hypothetical protein